MNNSVTVVIPAFNEADNLEKLILSLAQTFENLGCVFPVLLIDDGSTDRSLEILDCMRKKHSFLKVVRHPKRSGVTEVWKTALTHVNTELIFWGQADLETDPCVDIPLLLSAWKPGVDVVAGWRQGRGDGKLVVSKFANRVCRFVFGLQVNDMNWVKLIRRDLLSEQLLDRATHRYFLAVLAGQGCKITEVPTPWYPRYSGKSKFGPSRIISSALDFAKLLVWWVIQQVRPIKGIPNKSLTTIVGDRSSR